MAEVKNRSLRLSAANLQQLTGWPDPVIEEFLALLDNVNNVIVSNNEITVVVDEGKALAAQAEAGLGWVRARLRDAILQIEDNEALAAEAIALAYRALKKNDGITTAQIAARVHAGQ